MRYTETAPYTMFSRNSLTVSLLERATQDSHAEHVATCATQAPVATALHITSIITYLYAM